MLRRARHEPMSSRSSRTRIPSRARAASACRNRFPTTSASRMKNSAWMWSFASAIRVWTASYASSPLERKVIRFPETGGGVPDALSTLPHSSAMAEGRSTGETRLSSG